MQVGQQYGGNAVTIATADKQRRQDEEKTSIETVLEAFHSTDIWLTRLLYLVLIILCL